MALEDCIGSIAALGFTDLEAEIYVFLLQQSPATGYRVAQALGKPAANTYKAIETLQKKGAILVEDGVNRQCRAIPYEELLGQLERGFLEKKARAANALTELHAASEDERVYQIRSIRQVMERCRNMLARCTEVAIIDIFPLPLDTLQKDIEQTAARGPVVAVQVYEPTEVAGAEVVVRMEGSGIQQRWPGQWLNLVVDGSEHLIAFLTADAKKVHQAVWSGSVYLSWIYHSSLCCELETGIVRKLIQDGESPARLKQAVERCRRFHSPENPGYRTLRNRYGNL